MRNLLVGTMLALAAVAAHATPQTQCQAWVNVISKQLPYNADEVTTLTSVTCNDTTLIANYTVHDLPPGKYIEWNTAERIVIESACKQAAKNWMRDGITGLYIYKDVTGAFMHSLTFDRSNCSNT